jgi:hypothetical protein
LGGGGGVVWGGGGWAAACLWVVVPQRAGRAVVGLEGATATCLENLQNAWGVCRVGVGAVAAGRSHGDSILCRVVVRSAVCVLSA